MFKRFGNTPPQRLNNRYFSTCYFESGRSMVEMLGIMAIVGVISITGIYGYTKAMERHRANELLNEASKRAVLLSGQMLATGKIPETLSDDEDTSGHTYKIGKKGNNQFTLGISGVKEETCELMKQMAGGAIQNITCENDTATFTFNNDLSTKSNSGSGDNTGGNTTASTEDGWTGDEPGADCTGITPPTVEAGQTACSVCLKTGDNSSDWFDSNALCGANQVCVNGVCSSTLTGDGCLKNSDCKTLDPDNC